MLGTTPYQVYALFRRQSRVRPMLDALKARAQLLWAMTTIWWTQHRFISCTLKVTPLDWGLHVGPKWLLPKSYGLQAGPVSLYVTW